jgi:hypothetical protein
VADHFWQFVARLYGCEKFELPNLCAGLHREPLFISAHMSLTTEAHSVVAIYNQPQMATTVIAAVFHDSLGRLRKAWCHPRWRYGESSTHARSLIQRAPRPNCNRLTNVDFLTLCLIGKSGWVMSPIPEKFLGSGRPFRSGCSPEWPKMIAAG